MSMSKTTKTTDTLHRTSRYNPNRPNYWDRDCVHYCYTYLDPSTGRYTTKKYKIGTDVDVDVVVALDEMDHDEDLNDRRQQELRHPLFDRKQATAAAAGEEATSPWDTLADSSTNPEVMFCDDPIPEDPAVAVVRKVIEEDCTPAQRALFNARYHEQLLMEEIRQEELAAGKKVSPPAMTNRLNKVLNRVGKELGVEPVKRRKVAGKADE